MFVEIPLAGNCEINELKYDFYWDNVPLEYDFTVIKKDNSFFLLCDPDITVPLCKHLFDKNPFTEPLIDFYSPDCNYWFYCRNCLVTCIAEETIFDNIFDLYLEFGFIKKIQHEDFKNITLEGRDYIYVYSDLYFKHSVEFYNKIVELAKTVARCIKDDKDEHNNAITDNQEDKAKFSKEIKEDFDECLNKIDKALEETLANL